MRVPAPLAALIPALLPALLLGAAAHSAPAAVPAHPEALGIVTHGPRDPNSGGPPRVALTFDADMTPGMERELASGKVASFNNVAVPAILIREQVPATFFLTGMWAEEYPAAARALAQNPLFEIENHSYSHPGFAQPCYGLPAVPRGDEEAEFTRSQAVIERATGVTPKYFRFPGGCARQADVEVAESHGLQVVHWDVISGDAEGLPGTAIAATVLREARGGSIVVMHAHGGKAAHTADALDAIIRGLRARGFVFVKVQDLLGQK